MGWTMGYDSYDLTGQIIGWPHTDWILVYDYCGELSLKIAEDVESQVGEIWCTVIYPIVDEIWLNMMEFKKKWEFIIRIQNWIICHDHNSPYFTVNVWGKSCLARPCCASQASNGSTESDVDGILYFLLSPTEYINI